MAEQSAKAEEVQAGAENPAAESENGEKTPDGTAAESVHVSDSAEIARLKAELAAQITKNDTLARENATQKQALNKYKSAEEIREEERAAEIAETQRRLEAAEKTIAVTKLAKHALDLGADEKTADALAEHLYGAADADAAISLIGKVWEAREKKLKIEYGKIPSPGIGDSGGPNITREALSKLSYKDRAAYAREHPDWYNQLMQRSTK